MTMFRDALDYLPAQAYEDEQWVATEFAKQSAEYRDLAFSVYGRLLAHNFGVKFFWDLTPAERKHIYGQYPPLLLDGTIQPPHPDVIDPMTGMIMQKPPWDWGRMAIEEQRLFDMHVQDYSELMRDELKKIEAAIEESYEPTA